jgi:hypothetical protein
MWIVGINLDGLVFLANSMLWLIFLFPLEKFDLAPWICFVYHCTLVFFLSVPEWWDSVFSWFHHKMCFPALFYFVFTLREECVKPYIFF